MTGAEKLTRSEKLTRPGKGRRKTGKENILEKDL